jgi:arginyl-tRNA synthetase
MFEREQQVIEATVRGYCSDTGLPDPGKLKWNPIPFSGEWGISTSFFQLAAQEARNKNDSPTKLPPVQMRAQEIASAWIFACRSA